MDVRSLSQMITFLSFVSVSAVFQISTAVPGPLFGYLCSKLNAPPPCSYRMPDHQNSSVPVPTRLAPRCQFLFLSSWSSYLPRLDWIREQQPTYMTVPAVKKNKTMTMQ